MLRSDHSSARSVDQLGVGLGGAERPLDHAGGVVEAAQHPGHVAPRRVRQLPLGQRLGRLALEVDDLPPVRGAQGLAEVQVAVDLLDVEAAEVGDLVEGGPQALGVLLQLGYDGQRGVQARGHRRGQLGGGGGRPGLGGEVLAQGVVHVAERLAEPGRLAGEVAAGVVGVHLGVGVQAAHADQGEVPAVDGGAQELLEHRELQHALLAVGGHVRDLEPAVEGGNVLGPGPGEDLVDRDVGVDAGRDLAEDLHQRVLAEGHRGVGLLAGEERRVRFQVELVARQPVEPQPVRRRPHPRPPRRRPAATAPWPHGRGGRRRRAPSRGRGPSTSPRRRGRAGPRGARRAPAGPGRARCRPPRRSRSARPGG